MKNEKVVITGMAGKPSVKALYPHLSSDIKVVEKVDLRKNKELIRVHLINNDFNKYKSFPKNQFSIENSIVIRWGNRIPMILKNCVVYNKAEAVLNASNKKIARQKFQDEKVSIPKLITPKNLKEEYLPIIARPSFHAMCKNMRILKTKEEFIEHYKKYENKGWYYSEFINKEHEYRIHCAHGKVLTISEKPKPKNQTEKNIIFGWGYSVVEEEWNVLHWSEYKAAWCKLALKAVSVLGLDFGAVDIIVKGKNAYVLEVNTAGSLTESPYLQKRYSMYFNWLFKSKEKREHWEYEKFESGKSLAWKNFQLF